MEIEAITNFEVAEKVRFYGSIVGTEGVSKEIQDLCNKNIMRLLQSIQPELDNITAKKAGLITKQ